MQECFLVSVDVRQIGKHKLQACPGGSMIVKMPNVRFCNVHECAYNDHDACHALAITVEEPAPLCNTYFKREIKGGFEEFNGSVGACKNDQCLHNSLLECTATSIQVSKHNQIPACDTFEIKS
jgi:hypothetical protein